MAAGLKWLACFADQGKQVVFLDDNIKGAGQPGIKTILVTSYQQMTEELKANRLLS